jgi:hypothetical protein
MPPTALSRASAAVSLVAAGTCITFSLQRRRTAPAEIIVSSARKHRWDDGAHNTYNM